MKQKVFIDGSAGTTGLRIVERLESRADLELIRLPEELRKDPAARAEAINGADIVFLCLPEAASREAVALCTNPATVIIDTSTAHRTHDDWTYGFPEIGGLRAKIATSKRIANPGCHASGFIALTAPLVSAGVLKPDADLSCFSLTGYSGGGKKMIAEYREHANAARLEAPRLYGLTQQHKHLPEMKKLAGLAKDPHFCPIVSSYYAGMEVMVPVFAKDLNGGLDAIQRVYREYYTGRVVRFAETMDEGGLISSGAFAGRDDMQVGVTGNDERIVLVARFDNLGKGASGAAIQNMNIVLGTEETAGLKVEE